jgi:hypothetical protein
MQEWYICLKKYVKPYKINLTFIDKALVLFGTGNIFILRRSVYNVTIIEEANL